MIRPTDLRGMLQYVPQFRDRVFVIAIDGVIVTDENFANLLLDVAVLRSLNIRVVMVHGASAQIRQLAEQRGVQPSDLEGSGVTDAITLDLALDAANRLTHEILEGLAAHDLRAACTNGIVAHPLGILRGVDHQFTGRVERVDSELFRRLLDHGIVLVVPPLGTDGEGHTYRLNSDHVAVALAQALQAVKIIFVTSHDGLIYQGQLVRQVLAADLEQMLEQHREDFPPELLSKAIYCAAACRAGVPRVHVINGRVDEGLLAEVFSNEGIGTLVYANEYQQIRRARKKDIRAILHLTQNAVATEGLLRRTRAGIEKHLDDYYIFEIDQNPVACAALHVYPETKQGEIACLYVSPSHQNQGIGRRMVQYLERKARELDLRELFALSTQAFTYFQNKAGFQEATPDILPPERRTRYEQSGRKSKVLRKVLN